MKILERYDQTKEVQAWGETWTVPAWTNWICIDIDGDIAVFRKEPKAFTRFWVNKDSMSDRIESVAFEGDWRESLVYVGEQ